VALPLGAGRRAGALAIGALAALALSGCWGARFVRMPSYAEETRAEVSDLTAQNAELLRRLERMDERLGEQSDLLRSIRAESASEMTALRERIEMLEERIGTSSEARSRAPRAAADPGAGAPADTSAGGPPGPDPRARYDAAYLELLKGNYDLAIAGFTDHLERHPDDELADNAQYWIGECHLARGETAQAIEAFVAVELRWPQSDKIPDALFKIAACHQTERHFGAARRTYEDLIARFPKSEKAQLARDRLATLPPGD
jgi:tol-pal system protein YbgF